jgi:hypothetical protein
VVRWAALVCPQARRPRLLLALACPRSRARSARFCRVLVALAVALPFWRTLQGPPCVRDAQARGWGAAWAWQRVLEALGAASAVPPGRALLPAFRTAKLRACSTGPSWSRATWAPPARAGAARRARQRAELELSDARAPPGRAGAVRRPPPGPSRTRRPWLPSWSAPPARAGAVGRALLHRLSLLGRADMLQRRTGAVTRSSSLD